MCLRTYTATCILLPQSTALRPTNLAFDGNITLNSEVIKKCQKHVTLVSNSKLQAIIKYLLFEKLLYLLVISDYYVVVYQFLDPLQIENINKDIEWQSDLNKANVGGLFCDVKVAILQSRLFSIP